jgi:adenosylmethionine-8-amino-7-oxononanoate aminotransferase
VADAISRGSGTFLHGFTYNAHPVAVAAGNAVLDYIEREQLFERVQVVGNELREALDPLKRFSVIGDIRGAGLLLGIEFVSDTKTRAPFPADARVAVRIQEDAFEAGVMTYPIQGCVDGVRGDHILIAPPFTITTGMIHMLVSGLERAIGELERTHTAGTGGTSAPA